MSESEFLNTYQHVCAWYNISLTVALLVADVVVITRTRGRIDLPSKFVIALYTLSFLLQSFIWARWLIINSKKDKEDIIFFTVMNSLSL